MWRDGSAKRKPEATPTPRTCSLATVFCVGCFRAFHQRNRFLLAGDSYGLAERSLNFILVTSHSRKKHTAKPVKFSGPPALFGSFDQYFCLPYYSESFGSAIRQVQSFGL